MHEYIRSQKTVIRANWSRSYNSFSLNKFNASITGGKSSVLTALIVGLGGKATATNRGSSLKMFIQKGET